MAFPRPSVVVGLVAAGLLTAAVVAGCSCSRPAPPRTLPAERNAEVVYVALGDSTVEGIGATTSEANYVSRLSLDHSYNSNYTRQYQNRPGGGGERTDGQRVAYGFSPLVGLNFTFKELLKGSFGANMRYNTSTSYDLATSSRNIVETLAQEISVTASYSRKGFEIPFFGLSLNNDIDISASYSVTKNSRRTYDVTKLDVNTDGTPLEGTTRTVIEPRIKYVLSLRVTASVYYRYTKIAPDDSGSRIPGNTTNEAGLDIHVAIQ